MNKKRVVGLMVMMLMMVLCGCAPKDVPTETADYYFVPHGFVTDNLECESLIAMADKLVCPIDEKNALEIISGYCWGGRFVFHCGDMSLIHSARLEFMDKNIEGFLSADSGEMVFIENDMGETATVVESWAGQPMRLILNNHEEQAAELTMAVIQPVQDLSELGQVITQDGVKVLCVLDEDCKGAVLTAFDAEGKVQNAWVKKVTAYDQAGEGYDLEPFWGLQQYAAFPEALWGQTASIVLEDIVLEYAEENGDKQDKLTVEIDEGQQAGKVMENNKQQIGPYEVEITSYNYRSDNNISLSMTVAQDKPYYLEGFSVQTIDGGFGMVKDKSYFCLNVSRDNIEGQTLTLPITAYSVMHEGQWTVNMP